MDTLPIRHVACSTNSFRTSWHTVLIPIDGFLLKECTLRTITPILTLFMENISAIRNPTTRFYFYKVMTPDGPLKKYYVQKFLLIREVLDAICRDRGEMTPLVQLKIGGNEKEVILDCLRGDNYSGDIAYNEEVSLITFPDSTLANLASYIQFGMISIIIPYSTIEDRSFIVGGDMRNEAFVTPWCLKDFNEREQSIIEEAYRIYNTPKSGERLIEYINAKRRFIEQKPALIRKPHLFRNISLEHSRKSHVPDGIVDEAIARGGRFPEDGEDGETQMIFDEGALRQLGNGAQFPQFSTGYGNNIWNTLSIPSSSIAGSIDATSILAGNMSAVSISTDTDTEASALSAQESYEVHEMFDDLIAQEQQ